MELSLWILAFGGKQEEVPVRDRVEKVIAEIRPHLEADGGNIELIDVQDGIVKVRLVGACGSCPMSQMTLKRGVEARLKAQIPEVKEVVAV
jgi:Fe-S cluster biogenesis protein NfuA